MFFSYTCIHVCRVQVDLNFGIEHIAQASFPFNSSSETNTRDSGNFRSTKKHVIFPDPVSFIYRNYPLFTGQISDRFCRISHGYGLSWEFRAQLAALIEVCGDFEKSVSIHILYRNAIFCNSIQFCFRSYFNCSKLPLVSSIDIYSSYWFKYLRKPTIPS
jgi:hypothetical protein